MKRRSLLKALSLAGLFSIHKPGTAAENHPAAPAIQHSKPSVIVVGAGIFGSWTALRLLRSGYRVTLIDRWGAGHSRASSGGEHRVIRHAYRQARYVSMVSRAFELWDEFQATTGRKLFHRTGLLFMDQNSQSEYLDAAQSHMQDMGVQAERLSPDVLAARYPELFTADIGTALHDPSAGYLMAREATQAVASQFQAEGGQWLQSRVQPGQFSGGSMSALSLVDGKQQLKADQYVFACGPWLPELFPELISPHLTVSRQTVYFFGGLDSQSSRLMNGSFPVWADLGDELWYGIAAQGNRGFKLANDSRGEPFDPGTSDRVVSKQEIAVAREYLARRFPSMASAPLLESRVCQYSNTADGDFIMDVHPEASNVWLLGAGNGHGFKHGPAVGELMSNVIQSKTPRPDWLSLSRFTAETG